MRKVILLTAILAVGSPALARDLRADTTYYVCKSRVNGNSGDLHMNMTIKDTDFSDDVDVNLRYSDMGAPAQTTCKMSQTVWSQAAEVLQDVNVVMKAACVRVTRDLDNGPREEVWAIRFLRTEGAKRILAFNHGSFEEETSCEKVAKLPELPEM